MANKANFSLAKRVDWFTVILYLLMVAAGWVAICGASYDFNLYALFQMGSRPVMQLIWIGLALIIGFAILLIDTDFLEDISPFLYVIMLLILAVTIFVAPNIKGSHSWLVIGPLRLQPAEFAKVTTALMLSRQLGKYGFKIKGWRNYAMVFGIICAPMLLILLQSETGSALVFSAFFLVLYREGMTGSILSLAFAAIVYFVFSLIFENIIWWGTTRADLFIIGTLIFVFSVVGIITYCHRLPRNFYRYFGFATFGILLLSAIIYRLFPFDFSYVIIGLDVLLFLLMLFFTLTRYRLSFFLIGLFIAGSALYFYSVNYIFDHILEPHQQTRIKVALNIEEDFRGNGYNVDQSKIAIGSGGLLGKGFLDGTQTKLNYVPEQATDFIFCTIGEEQGFLGSMLLLLGYTLLILRLCYLAERQEHTFGRVYGYSVASILLFHLFINVGMVLGLVPVIGIPLPFFSYGGSSLWGFTLLIFIFLGIDARRTIFN